MPLSQKIAVLKDPDSSCTPGCGIGMLAAVHNGQNFLLGQDFKRPLAEFTIESVSQSSPGARSPWMNLL